MNEIRIIPIEGIPEIKVDDNLAEIAFNVLSKSEIGIEKNDIFIVTQKIVSKSEGMEKDLSCYDFEELLQSESKKIIRKRGDLVITKTKHGFICANAGIDKSNVKKNSALLLPEDPNKSAYKFEVTKGRYSKLLLEEASGNDYDIVVIEMDTYGGALNDADDIRTRILDFDKPIYSWINKDAASAGALISIACDSIYMSSGASIGAATVVTADGNAAPDKYQSYMRSIMRSTAEAKNRDPNIAEAMVDQDVKIDSLSQEGKVITFSTSEAIKNGFCEAEINSIDELMNHLNYDNYEINKFQLSSTENIISFFLNPMISSVLILIILGGIYFELQTPGVGFPIMAAIIAGILYLTPYYLNGLAENWEILMFLVGIILIGIEIFVIPGFGFFGILISSIVCSGFNV